MLTSPVLKSFNRFYLLDRCLRLWQISLYLSLQVFHCIPTDKVRSLSDLNTYKVRGGKGFLAQNYRSDFTKAFLRDESVCLSSLGSRETLYITCGRARKYQKSIPRKIIPLAGGYAGDISIISQIYFRDAYCASHASTGV